VATSNGLGNGGLTVIDLPTGATHRLVSGGASGATFAPDGRRALYVKNDKLQFAKP
jgi:hypothetical protein